MEVAVTTDVGTAQRHNEDGWCAEQLHRNVTLLAVADGFGHPGGTSAATITLDVIRDAIRRELRHAAPPRSLTGADVRDILITAFSDANDRLLHLSGGSDDHVSAAATCTAVLIVSNQAFIAHVGDARAYLFRRGELVQLTSDESIVPDLVTSSSGMPRPARFRHVRPLLTRALGVEAEAVAPKVTHYTLHPRDAVLFCTDGAYRALGFTDLQLALNNRDQRAEWITDRVLTLSRAAGSVDNATVLLAREATEHGAPPDGRADAKPRRSLTAALVAMTSAALLGISFMWTADTKMYLGTGSGDKVTLYSGSPLNVLGVPLHVARTTYTMSARRLPRVVEDKLDGGIAVDSPEAAAALVAQWQAKAQH
jgi:PPM family protein phosphatase